MAGKRAVSRARRTVVHHRDTLARTRVLLAARAGVPVARSDARRKKDSKRGNGYVVRVAAVARVFSDSSSRSRRARGSRRASPRHRRPPRAPHRPPHRSAPFRARARTPPARADAPRPPPVPRSPALSRSSRRAWLWCFLSRPPRAAGAAPRVVSRVAIHPDANDVTAAATASSRSRVVAALGTAAVPGRVHFLVSDAPGAWTHDGAFALPAGAGAVRSAAVVEFARDGARHPTETYFALGTDQKPGLIVPAGALAGTPLVLEKGEDVLATAVASEAFGAELTDRGGNEFKNTPCFVFATWTSPSRLVRVDVDEETRALRRAATTTLPLGVNRVRAAVADPRRLSFGDGADADGSRSRRIVAAARRRPFARAAFRVGHLPQRPGYGADARPRDRRRAHLPVVESGLERHDRRVARVQRRDPPPLKETDVEGGAASYWVTRPGTTLRRRANACG